MCRLQTKEFALTKSNRIVCGDVVKLKSANQRMTAVHVTERPNGETWVSCLWFLDGNVKGYEFIESALSVRRGEDYV
ncbi:MAG: DUF2158 domain-containing protein [Planctomycetes bacterium]|nr:DUF2158 domain-containing protein [Planctomycetota bacterium]